MKNILVTGGGGYIGSHIVQELLDVGYWPITFDNLSQGHRDAVLGGDFIEGDLLDLAALKAAFQQHKIDAVIHLAASSIVSESVERPLEYYRNNIVGALNLLQAMLTSGVNTIVFSSSASVYGDPASTPISEEHACVPNNPYGWSKLIFEQILEDTAKSQGLRYVSLRYFNVAGHHPNGRLRERHHPETHLVPRVIEAISQGQTVEIYGTDYPTPDGTCVRDYVHVCDIARAHISALEHLNAGHAGGIYNLGNGKGFSVKEVISAIEGVLGRKAQCRECPRRSGDPAVLVASATKALRELGWEPRYTTIESIIPVPEERHRHQV
ncbi:UDP-glucose 4-epimerase GalE [candidate division Kazan bacterium RBG_13_50_9]|uniref:UDP-glucose 4-epimerase n=1 Tax=candidate division Kazan bacterium RBG_13_50_9 TaxID=1798535 RepID=A0A1F4NRI3_UNCK3|nr:MAG: UDP-glucose 4-epimerase GalE [candidate division Kazan bacterium RBG_13_50_9]